MGYPYYEIEERKRDYGVRCKCHNRGCPERIDRGLSFLCHCCTWYFCRAHLTTAWDQDDNMIEVDSFAGKSGQVCQRCADHLEADALAAMVEALAR